MKTGCGGVSWNDDGTPRGIALVACCHSSRDFCRLARNSCSSRLVSSATRPLSMRAIFTSVGIVVPRGDGWFSGVGGGERDVERLLEDVLPRHQLIVGGRQRHEYTDDILVQPRTEQCQTARM